ncbi:BTB/POZ and MATH domain-containing protein 2 [Rhynchospora pubera]|uniref:BTB/POZ and MATH domain-containing protein 2 n=1 Tax=Rhynchospora pubera TaxID=906938 RepID=A0AAV8F3K6_9POAL|nr:BTB/POZ and MATH domain-containing protein 2 [Rhynchospora pubera]
MATGTGAAAASGRSLTPLAPSKSSTVTGWHEFTIERYSATKGLGVGLYLPSGPFSVGGQRWQICFFPDGENDLDADFVSIYVDILNPSNNPNPRGGGGEEEQSVLALYGFQLLDGQGRPISKHRIACSPSAFSRAHPSRGFSQFMRRADLEASPSLLFDDLLVVKCSLSVYRSQPQPDPHHNYRLREMPALSKHLSRLLHSGDAADVTLTVPGGKSFRAHRCVLAARSPVFKQQLLPNNNNNNNNNNHVELGPIIVEDVEADTFESLLHFIYTDSLPPGESLIVEGSGKDESILKTQRLLAVADRYGVDKLKLMCEDKLCENMTLATVGDTLNLVERHNCPRLKALCFEFMTKFATHARQSNHSELKRRSSSSQRLVRTPAKRLRGKRTEASSSNNAGSLRRSARLRK